MLTRQMLENVANAVVEYMLERGNIAPSSEIRALVEELVDDNAQDVMPEGWTAQKHDGMARRPAGENWYSLRHKFGRTVISEAYGADLPALRAFVNILDEEIQAEMLKSSRAARGLGKG